MSDSSCRSRSRSCCSACRRSSMFRTARASRSGRPPESRSTTFPTTLIQTQRPSCPHTALSALLRDRVSHVFPAPAYRVEIAQTGAEGLERVAAACPDVILLDLRLPDQSGLDVLRQLRQIDARIPVVMVTVARSSDSAIEAMRHGAYDYLLKPIDLQK